VELDDLELAPEDEAVVERRLVDHRHAPKSAVPLREMEARLRSRFVK
jgi:anti-sigma factor RsiW